VFIRVKKVQGRNKTYSYAQIVESVRRKSDGKPRQRVLASLGRCSDLEIENLRAALRAAKNGQVVAPLGLPEAPPLGPCQAIDYLAPAVVLAMARRLGVTSLVEELFDGGAAAGTLPSQVVLALVCHRLIAPGSKLAATRWVRRTALPGLLDFDPSTFNNSRVHRVLSLFEPIRAQLQLRLAAHSRDGAEGAAGALFMDVTDTWFEGRGPQLAQRAQTKEGHWRKKIGIVLLCDGAGHPLRWKVIAGRQHDSKAMRKVARQVARIDWMQRRPIVFDRAMGKPAHLAALTEAGVRFVTLMCREAIDSYAAEDVLLPALADIDSDGDTDAVAQATARTVVENAGFQPVGRRLFMKELGIRRLVRTVPVSRRRRRRPTSQITARSVEAVGLLDALNRAHEAGEQFETAARALGVSRGKLGHIRALRGLRPEILACVREGRSIAPINALQKIARLDPADQWEAFLPFQLDTAPSGHEASPGEGPAPANDAPVPNEVAVEGAPPIRAYLVFDPVLFAAQRAASSGVDAKVRSALRAINEKLLSGHHATTPSSAERKLRAVLTGLKVGNCYDIVHRSLDGVGQVHLTRREDTWRKRRRAEGFRLFAVHPDLELTPEEVVDLYSAKNAVETDFRAIKSIVRLRPVHHSTDTKVAAHVDLCMLALAIERALQAALPDGISASAALEELSTVRVVSISMAQHATPTPIITTPSREQRRLLSQLDMTDLVDKPRL